MNPDTIEKAIYYQYEKEWRSKSMGLFDKGKDEVIESLRRMATELRDENARLT
ncbi:MAG: hypothetical protein HXS54_12165, partial [Theionarchaea archaeon]|nr:hypothetical protein [Theionarchaea archaeon]